MWNLLQPGFETQPFDLQTSMLPLRHCNITLHKVLYPGKMDATSLHHFTLRWIFFSYFLFIDYIDFLGQRHDWQWTRLYFFLSVCSGLSSLMLLLEFEWWSSPHGCRNSVFEPRPFELETNVLPLHHCETYLISW